MYLQKERKLRRRTPVYDHAGVLLFLADREKAAELMANPAVNAAGTTRTVTAFRFAPDVAGLSSGNGSKAPKLGQPHTSANYYNPAGVFTFDFIKPSMRPEFERVIRERGATDKLVSVPETHPSTGPETATGPSLPLQPARRLNVVEMPLRRNTLGIVRNSEIGLLERAA